MHVHLAPTLPDDAHDARVGDGALDSQGAMVQLRNEGGVGVQQRREDRQGFRRHQVSEAQQPSLSSHRSFGNTQASMMVLITLLAASHLFKLLVVALLSVHLDLERVNVQQLGALLQVLCPILL